MLLEPDLDAATRRIELLARTLRPPRRAPGMGGGSGGPLTTHVLDSSSGSPAAGLRLELFKGTAADTFVAERVCNSEGRVERLIGGEEMEPGVYMLRFHTSEYFAKRGANCFYPHCDITFVVEDATDHYHVPLILSPYGYSTYRGS
jgi:5-hydroxyisourate hydrolase